MQGDRRVFLISAGGTPAALRELVALLRGGWRVVESRPADQVSRAALPREGAAGLGEGPFHIVILERQDPEIE
jgi:hypothetical protein